jgi:NADPH-dependent 2,4-dienoyl-CoA reductase/sulfur reductase-like enzyme
MQRVRLDDDSVLAYDALLIATGSRARKLSIPGSGLEVATTCRKQGLAVTVLETQDRVMKRVVSKETSAAFIAEHVRNGVHVLCGAGHLEIAAHAGTRRVRAVVRDDGSEHEADIVLIGVVRRDPPTPSFSVCYLRAGELLSVESINNSKDAIVTRKLIATRTCLDPRQLADATRALPECR